MDEEQTERGQGQFRWQSRSNRERHWAEEQSLAEDSFEYEAFGCEPNRWLWVEGFQFIQSAKKHKRLLEGEYIAPFREAWYKSIPVGKRPSNFRDTMVQGPAEYMVG
ncbi:hypothetical protein PCH_Pc21g17860 [Penicillium rubens Wisconsin 54-1255]|uniref:Uncharacterized protein n=1 Tax=Penicillium rubens (strain ATCC 28089 / DSM 1075 / NRRL 1951 / Wisconsin 54-1255) TaxID=500485 RepID=B6HNC8_PENRW|nr:hypothetical protein PCH_Pc21g17860 [Penicillium rubens Wisconsin 54-1255]